MIDDPSAQDRTLAHATRSVKKREAGGNQIGSDYFSFLFAPKEAKSVFDRIRLQTDVRGIAHGDLPIALGFGGQWWLTFSWRQVFNPALERLNIFF